MALLLGLWLIPASITLAQDQGAVDANDIGEGAAGVDADSQIGASARHAVTPRPRPSSQQQFPKMTGRWQSLRRREIGGGFKTGE